MKGTEAIWDMADAIFECGDMYYWTMNGNIAWACKPIGPGPQLTQ